MKEKKLYLTKIIFIAAVAAMVLCVLLCGIARKPTVTQGEFPYSVTYSVKGEIKTLEGVYKAQFVGNESYADNIGRVYDGDDETWFTVYEDETGNVQLITHMYADYLMGDAAESDYFDGGSFAPQLVHYDNEGFELTDAEEIAARDVEIIEWDYPEPIENKLVFSHIAAMSGRVVLPLTIIALLALLAVLIFVKREETVEKTMAYRFHALLNFAVGVISVPLFAALGFLSDIIGIDHTVSHQLNYLLAPVAALGVAAAVALRRKGFSKASFIAQFAGVVLLGIMMLCALVEGTAY